MQKVTITFTGERDHPDTQRLLIAGLKFDKGKPVEVTPEQADELRKHPQFDKFAFEFGESAAEEVVGGDSGNGIEAPEQESKHDPVPTAQPQEGGLVTSGLTLDGQAEVQTEGPAEVRPEGKLPDAPTHPTAPTKRQRARRRW